MTTSHDCAARPQIDELIDVAVERILFRKNVQDAVHDHVRLQRAHEKQRAAARVAAPDHAGFHRPAEVVRDNRESATRRAVGSIGIERHHQ
jgi:hypothetical protein